MNALLVSDTHFTANARDEYRWKLFEHLHKATAQNAVTHLFILGDLCESKDYHSARLVNRIADQLAMLAESVHVLVLRGNHDGLNPTLPYFHFLRYFKHIEFITTPFMREYAGLPLLMLPHTPTPERDWKESAEFYGNVGMVFMHQTLQGAIGENGTPLDGIPSKIITGLHRSAKIWSGDVHVPQVIAGVEYVGAPYAVRFGDSFTPRLVLLENFRKPTDIINDWAPRRRFIDVRPNTGAALITDDALREADQVKVRIHLAPHEYIDWARCKAAAIAECKERKLELHGLELVRVAEKAGPLRKRNAPASVKQTAEQSLQAYCTKNEIGAEVAQTGQTLLHAAQQ